MMESMLSVIDLSEMNDKQLAKEFRATQKQIKSKSTDSESQLLQKLTDIRYFTIGGCLPPLLQALTTKKKYTAEHEGLLGVLDTFVGNPAFSGSQNAGFVTQALKHTLNSAGDLNVLQVLSDMTMYKEQVKITKANKGIPIEVQPENESAFFFRYTSLKILSSITSSLSSPNSVDQNLVQSFASIATLADSICSVVENLRIRYDDQTTKEGMLQEGIWALRILLFVFKGCPSTLKCLLSGKILDALRDFTGEESLSLYCLQIFEITSKLTEQEFLVIIDETMVSRVIDAVFIATEESTHRMDTASAASIGNLASTPGKGKSIKKEKVTVSNDVNTLTAGKADKSDAFKQTRRHKLACIKVAADILSAVCLKNGSAMTDPLINRLMTYFSRVLKDRTVWELAQLSDADPYDVCLSDVLERCCILIGSLGSIDSTRRRAACETGTLTLLLSVMQNSMAMFNCTIAPSASVLQSASIDDSAANSAVKKERGHKGGGSAQRVKIVEPLRSEVCTPREQTEKIRKVRSLRQVVEKSFLSLLGEMALPPIVTDAVRTSSASACLKRWHSASLYSLDHSLFEAVGSDEDDLACQTDGSIAKLFPAAALMELICCAGDVDLGSRGLRLLAAVLAGTHDPVALLKTFKLDATVMGNLSNAVQARVAILLETFDVKLKRAVVCDPNINTNFDASLDFSEVKECMEIDTTESAALGSLNEFNDVPLEIIETAARSEELYAVGDGEVLYLSLIVLETTLRLSPIAITTFATRDRLVLLASLLGKCGPTGNTGISSYHPAAEAIIECEVHLHDPRNDGRCIEGGAMTESVLLRPIIFDIVALIAASEETHRVLEPDASNSSLPVGGHAVYSSPCREAALSAAKLCGDVTVSTLLVQGQYALQPSLGCALHITAIPRGGKKLDLSVLDAALGCFLSMAKSGAINLYAILESVADADSLAREEASSTHSSSINGLREFLINLPSEDALHGDNSVNGEAAVDYIADPKACLYSKHMWTRALFFDQLFSGSTFETAPSVVLGNPSMWPYMSVCAALIGIMSDVTATVQTASLAIQATEKLCRVGNMAESAQPVVADSLATFFISMGGASALAGAVGKFGTFCLGSTTEEEVVIQHGQAINFLCYLVGRGRDREWFWQSKVPAASITPSDTKVQRAAAAAKDLEKKSKDKNAKDQKKGKSLVKMTEDASIVEDVSWNLESDGSHPDPNRGPNREFWKSLLESRVDERHTRSLTSTVLLVALQGGLSPLVVEVISEGAGVQMSDTCGVTPLMYALLLGDEQSASSLIEAGADIDSVDDKGNPAITYACHSASLNDLERVLVGPLPVDVPGEITALILGSCSMLPLLLAAGVDSSACSALGNSPILSVMGLGSVSLLIGGYRVTVGSKSYTEDSSLETVLRDVQSLLVHGAQVNACNRRGVVPLHIAAARGHTQLVDVLKANNALTNVKDAGGYLPIHYVAAASPASACDMFDYLLDCSKNRSLQRLVFSDVRERDKLKRQEEDISRKMREIFDDSLGTTTIRSPRLSEQDLLQNLCDEGMNLVQLCMSARALQLEPFKDLLSGEKLERIALIKHITAKAEVDMLSCVDCRGMTVMHASSLLLLGCTAKRTLSAAELRSKRIKSYPSPEMELLDAIREKGGLMEGNECDRKVILPGFTSMSESSSFSWTPLHGAIAANNSDLVAALLTEGQYNLGRHFYVHFLANTEAGPEVCDHIIGECSSSTCYGALLNGLASPHWTARPIHLAVRARNFHAVSRLLRCSKIDLNARDEESGMTALHEACRKGDLDALRIFGIAADRLDLLTVDLEGQTCTEFAICTKNIPMLELFIIMRRNDVLENVLRTSDASSILMQLEVENISLAKALGFCDPSCLPAEENSNDELNIIYTDTESNAIPAVHQDTVQLSPISMAESQTNDSNYVESDRETFGIRRITAVDLPTTETLLISDQILKLLIMAASDAGIPEEFHANSCFFRGLLYSEFAVRIH